MELSRFNLGSVGSKLARRRNSHSRANYRSDTHHLTPAQHNWPCTDPDAGLLGSKLAGSGNSQGLKNPSWEE
jgi:hypothetical protein